MEKQKEKPTVSVCTPTFNRRPFVPMMLTCFKHQTYPNILEWLIYDDGTDPIRDLVEGKDERIRYIQGEDIGISLGKKRNTLNDEARGDIIVYMDDDDYYPPERVSHAVETLLSHPEALVCGSSAMFVYFRDNGLYQMGPYGPMHATAASIAFWRVPVLSQTRFDESAAMAEERVFLKGYTLPLVQLNPSKTIVVFAHRHNTVDKRILLAQGGPHIHPVTTTEDYPPLNILVKDPAIRRFFLEELDEKLTNYAPGEPTKKPDAMSQLEESRMRQYHAMNNHIQELTKENTYLKEQLKFLRERLTNLMNPSPSPPPPPQQNV